MNKMKRIFSLVLVLSMVLGSFGSVFVAAEEAEKAEEVLTVVPKDVIGTEYEKAVSRLVAFGIVNGYKDGTYKPENDVTRAEFAKILIEALGIGNATRAAQGKTNFSDVPATHWASGYINVASGQGLLKGYPDGTFKPSAQVSYAEAMTMLVRALGYQDNFLKGNWPGNYVAKAAEAGISSGVKFDDAGKFAHRGNVAILVNNTLDADVVKVDVYKDGTIEYYDSEVTLLKDKLDISKYEDTRVIADKIVNDGLDKDEITVRFLKDIDKKETKSVRKDYSEGDEKDFRIKKGVNTRKYIGEESSVYMDNKDNIVYIETENDDKAYFDYVEAAKGDDKETEEISLVRFDKDYKFDKDAKVYVYDAKDDQYNDITVDKDGAGVKASDLLGRVGKFVVKNNRVIYAEIMESAEAFPWMLVKENKKGLLEGINQTTEDFDIDLTKDGNFDGVFVYDTLGNALDVEDIKEGNIVYAAKLDYDGDDYVQVVVVQDNMVEGELTKVKDDRVTIGDKQIKMVRYKDNGNHFQAYYSVEGFEDIKEWNTDGDWADDMEDADEEDMVAYLDATGKIAFLSTEAMGSSGYKYGVVTRGYADNDRVKIFTFIDGKDGDEITYKADKERNLSNPIKLNEYGKVVKDNKTESVEGRDLTGRVVKFKLNKEGEIAEDEFYVMDPENTWKMQADKDFGKDSIPSVFQGKDGTRRAFAIDDRAVIIDAESLEIKDGKPVIGDSDDFTTANWKDIAEDNYDSTLEYYVFTKRNNDIDIDAVVFIGKDGLSTSSDEEAIYVIDKWRKSGDVYVKYASYETGKVEEIEVDKVDKLSSDIWNKFSKERPFVARIKSGNKIELFTDNDSVKKNINKSDLTYKEGVVDKKDGSVLTVNGEEYRLASSAIVYEEDTKKSASNIRKGDAVLFVVENNVNIRVIERLIDSEAKAVKDGTGSGGGTTPGETEKGVVTYIDTTNKVVYVDAVPYTYGTGSVLKTAKGNVIASGVTNIEAKLAINDEVKDVIVKNGVIETFVGTKIASEIALANPIINQINALTSPAVQADVTAARNAYDALAPSVKELVTNLDKLVAKEAELANAGLVGATTAVETAETSQSLADVVTARGLVTALPAGTAKTALENRLAAIVIKVADVTELNAALADAKVKNIVLTADMAAPNKITRDDVTIDGAGKTITGKIVVELADNVTIKNLTVDANEGTPGTWNSSYAVHVYRSTGAKLIDVTTTKANAGLLVNGSEVNVTNFKSVANGFGGIEVSQGSGVTEENRLVVNGMTHDNAATPHIWIDGKISNGGWVVAPGLNEQIVGTQLFFLP